MKGEQGPFQGSSGEGQEKGDVGSEATAQTGRVRALGGSGPHLYSPWEAPGCWPTAWPSWSESHSCMRIKGSRPFCVSLLHGFGRDSMSLTLPCVKSSVLVVWHHCAEDICICSWKTMLLLLLSRFSHVRLCATP